MNFYILKRRLTLKADKNLNFYNCIYFSYKHAALNNPELVKITKEDLFRKEDFLKKSADIYFKYVKSIVTDDLNENNALLNVEYLTKNYYVNSFANISDIIDKTFKSLKDRSEVLKECYILFLSFPNEGKLDKTKDLINIYNKYINNLQDFGKTFWIHTVFIDFNSKSFSTEKTFMKNFSSIDEIKASVENLISVNNLTLPSASIIVGKTYSFNPA